MYEGIGTIKLNINTSKGKKKFELQRFSSYREFTINNL